MLAKVEAESKLQNRQDAANAAARVRSEESKASLCLSKLASLAMAAELALAKCVISAAPKAGLLESAACSSAFKLAQTPIQQHQQSLKA